MTVLNIQRSIFSRLFLLATGLASVSLAAFLMWVEVITPLNARLPVPSPDGRYFAYFDRVLPESSTSGIANDLIVADTQGRENARFPLDRGWIVWSNVGHLAVVAPNQNQVVLIPNAEGRFLAPTAVALDPDSRPVWSRDGAKLAFIRPTAKGQEIAVYYIEQTQAMAVPLPPDFHLTSPALLFWSPSSEELYFLNGEGQSAQLEKLSLLGGQIQSMVQGRANLGVSGFGLPRMSPDGTRIYLPPPSPEVIDAVTGEVVWALPRDAKGLWSPWSGDGHELFYTRFGAPYQILAHDFDTQHDQVVLALADPNGFFAADRRSYFSRTPRHFRSSILEPGLLAWLRKEGEWEHLDVASQSAQPLGPLELYPWEQTQDGRILGQRDDFPRVQPGLYDPSGRVFREYQFPTEHDDLSRQLKSRSITLLTVALYALLAFFVYLIRRQSAPARAFYLLSLVWMNLLASSSAVEAALTLETSFPDRLTASEMAGLGWLPVISPLRMLSGDLLFLVGLWVVLLPPALLHFAIVFPEGNDFLSGKKVLKSLLYSAAFLPFLGLVSVRALRFVPEVLASALLLTMIIAGPAVVATAFLALIYNYRNPPSRRAKDQVRWVTIAFLLPLAIVGVESAFNSLRSSSAPASGTNWPHLEGLLNATGAGAFWLITPLAIGYALVAYKLFDIQLLIRRTVRYSLMTLVAFVVFFIFSAGLGWAVQGSPFPPSRSVVVVSILLTVGAIAPVRNRLLRSIDRTFDRSGYDYREALRDFASTLPDLNDRGLLATRLSDTLLNVVRARRFYLFVKDQRAQKLRPQPGSRALPAAVASLDFDPGEPFCRYLVEQGRPFEVEVSPYDPRLIPIFRSAADRLSKLQAAVLFGLARKGELLGLMVLGTKSSDEFYNSEDLRLLDAVARQAAIALENIHLFEEVTQSREFKRELELASDVQLQLSPGAIPKTAGCEIAGRCVHAKSISGDYYDFLEIPGGNVGVVLGDVSGKDISGTLWMANLKSLLRAQAPSAENLTELFRKINRRLYASSQGAKYCTFFYGVFSGANRHLRFVNAGHNPPFVVSAHQRRFLESTGLPLGLFPEVSHEAHSELLDPGSVVVIYSDGITQARNSQGGVYGIDRLVGLVSGARQLDPPKLIEAILADLREFMSGAEPEDDQTVVVVKIADGAR